MRRLRQTPILLLLTTLVLTGCVIVAPSGGSTGTSSGDMPRWTCPTPTPQPYGASGPAKRTFACACTTDPVTLIQSCDTCREDYTIWEREYGALGDPAPAPTVYSKSDAANFFLGQLVNLAGWDMQIDLAGIQPSAEGQIVTLRVRVIPHGTPVQLDWARQVRITALRGSDGRQQAGSWGWSLAAQQASGTPDLPSTPLNAETTLLLPIQTPVGQVQVVDLALDAGGQNPNGSLRVQVVPVVEPLCGQPGTVAAVYAQPAKPVSGPAMPAGSDAVVAAAFAQLGRQYCWGAKGYGPCSGCAGGACVTPPCAELPCFDCSGLTWYAYQQVGITIGQGTANQKNAPAVWQIGDAGNPQDVAQPGDLLLFSGINANGRAARITHVGLYAGDLDGDGTGDMIHSANYPAGVVREPNVFGSRYYQSRLMIITRPPRGGER